MIVKEETCLPTFFGSLLSSVKIKITFLIIKIFFIICVFEKVQLFNPWSGCPQDDNFNLDCPAGWYGFDTNCYTFFVQTPLVYSLARQNCAVHGALLLRIDSLKQNAFISSKLDNIAVNRSLRWYTAGIMRPDSFGEFMWEGYPPNKQNVKTELMSLWLDTVPKPSDKSSFPPDRNRIVYGSDGNRWGWYLDTGTVERGYICQAPKAIANQLLPTSKPLAYGSQLPSNMPRGPCFLTNPQDVLYVSSMSVEKYAELHCEANGHPQPTYRWYFVNIETKTDKTGQTTTVLQRTLIDPTLHSSGRISISAGSLVIHSPETSTDSQMFQCEAINMHGSILSRTARIVFGQLETAPKQPRNDRKVMSHQSETLPCEPPSHSPADSLLYTVYMNKNGVLEPVIPAYRPNVFISQAKGLIGFSEVSKVDSGIYVCMITMQFQGQRMYDSLKLPDMPFTVSYSNEPIQDPRIYDDFPAVWPSNPQRGQFVRLECFAAGFSQLNGLIYRWRRLDGLSLRTNSVKDFGRVIELPNIQPEDQGVYECSVEDALGKMAKPKVLSLRITAKPYFISPLQDTVVDTGADVLLTCEASGIPSPEHEWYKNGVSFSQLVSEGKIDTTRYKIIIGSETRSSLQILKTQITDSSMFTCLAWNSLGSEASSAELKILELAPTFTKHPVMPNEGLVGSSAVMECQPEGAPKVKLEWFHDNMAITTSQSQLDPQTGTATCATKYCNLPSGNLLIMNLVDTDAGQYKCVATNTLGKAESSALLTVIPKISIILRPTSRVVYENSTVLLPCRAQSSPFLDINYAWYFEGVHIKFDRLDLDARRYEPSQLYRPYGRYFGTLRIVNIQFEYSGNYSCLAESPLGSLGSNGIVYVAGPPGPCGGVIVDPQVGINRVNVSWAVGTSHLFPITYFQIEANAVYDPPNQWTIMAAYVNITNTQELKPSGRRMTFIDNLAANMAYKIRVRAGNQLGLGSPSPPSLSFTTLPTAPTMLPQNLTGGGGKHGTLVFQWIPLPRVNENGPKFYYRAHIRAKGDSEYGIYDLWTAKLIPGTEFMQYTLTLGDNLYYKPYEVKIQAMNIMGSGPLTEPVTIMSAARVPTNAPGSVTAGAFNCSAIHVWWYPPLPSEGEGPTWGYRILYWPRISDCRSIESDKARYQLGQRQTVHGDVTEGLIIGLDADTYYCIAVQIFNSAGDGPESSFTEQTTFKQAPREFPTMVTLNATNIPNTILVSWVGIQAKSNEESVEGYCIRYWPAGSEFKQTFRDIDVGLKTYGYVSDLENDLRYNLRVYGYSRGGVGTMSSPVNQFQIIKKDKCIPGATWDGPDFRYNFICQGSSIGISLENYILSVIISLLVRKVIS